MILRIDLDLNQELHSLIQWKNLRLIKLYLKNSTSSNGKIIEES